MTDEIEGISASSTATESAAEHPMLTQRYAIYTPAITHFIDTIGYWIEERAPGGYIYGMSRVGKSKAISNWVKREIREKFSSRVAVFTIICVSRKITSDTFFYNVIAYGLGINLRRNDPINALDKIVNYMCASARESKSDYIVLILDEAQKLSDIEYTVLLDIQNQIERRKLQITFISVGTHELKYKHNLMLMNESAHLTARFMVRKAQFHGIAGSDQVAYILDAYDNHTEWPSGSGISFTKHFFTQAYDAGFRLSSMSEDMWEIYVDLAPEFLKKHLEVPMEHIAKAIEFLFRKFSLNDSADFQFTKHELYDAIVKTGYKNHMQMAISFTEK